jgi:bifunctional non-homologous end joining protein LigD
MRRWNEDPAAVRPMLATTAEAPLHATGFAYEPKYDGIRALASVDPRESVRLWSRLGNEKTRQFPEVVAALQAWGATLDRPVLLDGEIVALDEHGEPAGFQNLQGRIHLRQLPSSLPAQAASAAHVGTAFIAFDLLRDGDEDVRPLPLRERRARLEPLLTGARDPKLRLSELAVGDGRAMFELAQQQGWEGLVAKRLDGPYRSGRRSPEWVKLKLVRHQTCVIGGWTDPRGSRPLLGALLLGVYDKQGRLHYIGHTGAGFSDAELGRVWKQLQVLKTKTSPFATTPKTNERPHWAKPQLVAEVKFTEWTADGKLRHPTYLGLRDDVEPTTVRKEPEPARRLEPGNRRAELGARKSRRIPGSTRGAADVALQTEAADRRTRVILPKAAMKKLIDQLAGIEADGGDGVLQLPDGERLEVSNLGKTFWPALKLTKGDLFRHYVRVAPFILPVLADRPLVMKRYPNGVAAKPFYQHRAPDKAPPGVRTATVQTGTERRLHLIGGDLTTLLYTVQLASISQDPWFSRVGFEDIVDHVAIDLDPPEGLPFARVLDVAKWVRDELDALKAVGFPKTSGSGGLHIYIPMPPGTRYDIGLLFCQIVATMVARKHPKLATVERSVGARGRRTYVDYLQNIRGKTLASAYSARANDFAGVSAPLTWTEVDEGASPQDFTLRTFGDRLAQVGDLWAELRKAKGVNLRAVEAYAER